MMDPNNYSNPYGAPPPTGPHPMNGTISITNPFEASTKNAADPWATNPTPPPPSSQSAPIPDSESVGGYSYASQAAQNPFGAPHPAAAQPAMNGNPYGAPPIQQSSPSESYGMFGTQVQQQTMVDPGNNPFGLAPPQQQSQPAVNPGNPYGAAPPQLPSAAGDPSNPFGGAPLASQEPPPNPPNAPYGNSSYGQVQASNPFAYTPDQNPGAMVVALNQSNPYAMSTTSMYGQSHPQQQHQIVPAPQTAQPWAMQQYPTHQQNQSQQQLVPSYGGTQGYDPFTVPPPPAPAPAYEPVSNEMDLFFQTAPPKPVEPYQPPKVEAVAPTSVSNDPPGVPANGQPRDPPPKSVDTDDSDKRPAPSKPIVNAIAPPPGTTYPPQIQYGQRPDAQPDPEPTQSGSPRNPYAPALAREAPPGASPLPRADLVRKRGFVLGRISFRTIVMKKWKQTYWVQYGPHTMLWFRSQADFDDWLNNPYHLQTERNFLIKLAVNFVHDLYKPNVRGYQVTQCRTKGYGNKIVRQFKLERWMDYGPTIAAAFGSYNPAEVDALREAVVECMRNTPLNGGIRATGAVRQPNPPSATNDRSRDDYDDEDYREEGAMGRRTSYDELPKDKDIDDVKTKQHQEAESVAEEADLLDVNNWDDVPSEPQTGPPVSPLQQPANGGFPPSQHGPSSYGLPPRGVYPGQAPQQHQPQQLPYGQANPYATASQQPNNYSTALVPAVGQPQAYPGAPTPSQWDQQHSQQPHGYTPPLHPAHPAYHQPGYQPPHPTHSYPQPPPPADPWGGGAPQQQAQNTYLPPPQY